jgi:hypothetical protein
MQRTPRIFACELTATAFLLAAGCGTALAQAAPPAPSLADPNVREVSMVRQDFSDCPNGDVSDQDPSRIGGTVVLVRNTDGTTAVKVFITAAPNTKYNFFLKCVRSLGTLTTYEEGEAEATFSFRTNETGNVFAFDMYPDGAPAGNKFQSVQVKF